jgi:hypothetical protein
VDELPNGTGKYDSSFLKTYYQNQNVSENCFSLSEVMETHIVDVLKSISAHNATGLDNVSARFLKDGASVLARPLAHLINLSISSGIVPNDLKSARVVPLHKKNSKTSVGNYRPVSILSVVSKVFEKVVYSQLNNYLQHSNLLYSLQSGFRSNYSTDTCLIHLLDHLRSQSDKGNFTGMVMLDLQKAFDTVNHEILFSKLSAMGVDHSSVNWFKSYLQNRTQVVEVKGTMSDYMPISCGVPQGSILGPLLFLVYVNDLPASVKCKTVLYADDSALLVSGKDVSEIEQTLSSELQSVCNWLVDNKLSIHLGKTESILFGSCRKLKDKIGLHITCNGSNILAKSEVKYLGVSIDQSFTGNNIASNVVSKSTAKLKNLYRNCNQFSLKTKKVIDICPDSITF